MSDCGLKTDLLREAPCGLLPRPAEATCAKRTQFPARPGGAEACGTRDEGYRAKRTQFPRRGLTTWGSSFAPRPSGASAANHAKRTQFPAAGIAPLFQYSTNSSIPARCRLCKTKPIWPATPAGTGPQGRGTRGKRAKRIQFRSVGQLDAGGPVVQTNPIPIAVPIRRSAFPGAKHAKRSQFLDCGLRILDCGFRQACGLSPWARAGRLYKQSQSAGGSRAKRTQFPGEARWDEATGAADEGGKCAKRTQFPRRGRTAVPRPSTLRPRPRRANCANGVFT